MASRRICKSRGAEPRDHTSGDLVGDTRIRAAHQVGAARRSSSTWFRLGPKATAWCLLNARSMKSPTKSRPFHLGHSETPGYVDACMASSGTLERTLRVTDADIRVFGPEGIRPQRIITISRSRVSRLRRTTC